MDYPKVYGLWTSKGGVGKTTLSFHLSTTYAELFHDKAVVVIDMCPQCNLSATLLTTTRPSPKTSRPEIVPGDTKVEEYQTRNTITGDLPRTVSGYISNELNRGVPHPIDEWLIPVHDVNPNMPKNLHLLCGDSLLDSQVNDINAEGLNRGSGRTYTNVMSMMRNFVIATERHFLQQEKEVVFFVDTNPALTAYTELALVAITDLIVPVSADNFSLQAVRSMFHLVYGLYPRTVGPAALHEENTFANLAKRNGLPVPTICCIVHNKNPVQVTNKAVRVSQDGNAVGFIPPRAFKRMARNQAQLLFEGYKKAINAGSLGLVFRPPLGGVPIGVTDVTSFSATYTGTIRDMRSCGLASMQTGLPLWELVGNESLIPPDFVTADFGTAVPYLGRDVLLLLKKVLGVKEMAMADPDARHRILGAIPAGTIPADGDAEGGHSSEDDGDP